MSKNRKLTVSVLSILLGFLVGALVMVAFGYSPVEGYKALFKGALGSPFNIGQTIRAATPLIFTGLGFAVANTAGFFNIGLPGQALAGWLVSVWIALSVPEGSPSYIVLPLAVIGGALAGALWASIAGVLKAYFNASEVIVTTMLNHMSLYISDHIVRYVITDRMDVTPYINEEYTLRWNWLTELTNNSTAHSGIFYAIIAAFIVYYIINKTKLGYELRATGLNRHATEYAGMNSKRNIILAMAISGALAGLGGVMNGLGEFRSLHLMNGTAPAIGFDGMSVALLGLLHPIGILFAAFLFGGLKVGGNLMPMVAGIPTEVVNIIISCIVFFVGSSYVIEVLVDKFSKKEKQGGDE